MSDSSCSSHSSVPSRPAWQTLPTFAQCGLLLGGVVAGALGAFWACSHGANLRALSKTWPPFLPLTSHDRLFILSPHLDDESLGAGGLMAQARKLGMPVRIVFLTNGDGSRSTLIAHNLRRKAPQSMVEFALLRQEEARTACAQLGVGEDDIIFLGYPDGGGIPLWEKFWESRKPFRSLFTGLTHSPYADTRTLRAPYSGEALWRDVVGAFRDFQPTLVLTTHPADTHPDHAAAYNFAALALETLRSEPASQAWATLTRLENFMVHYGVWPVPNGLHPAQVLAPPAPLHETGTQWTNLDLDADVQAIKLHAINCYTSQLAVTPRYLRAFARRNEIFGSEPLGCDAISVNTATGLSPHRALWPASDVRHLSIKRAENGALHIAVQLCAAPSERLRYEVVLHAVVPIADGTSQIRRATLVFASEDGWTAYWRTAQQRREIPMNLAQDTLRVEVPSLLTQQLLGSHSVSLLAGAALYQGQKVLTRVPVAVGRFGDACENSAIPFAVGASVEERVN